jgi:hypothetical protein
VVSFDKGHKDAIRVAQPDFEAWNKTIDELKYRLKNKTTKTGVCSKRITYK